MDSRIPSPIPIIRAIRGRNFLIRCIFRGKGSGNPRLRWGLQDLPPIGMESARAAN